MHLLVLFTRNDSTIGRLLSYSPINAIKNIPRVYQSYLKCCTSENREVLERRNKRVWIVTYISRRVRKIAKRDYYLRRVCPQGTSLLPQDGFSWNSDIWVFFFSKNLSPKNSSFTKLEQQNSTQEHGHNKDYSLFGIRNIAIYLHSCCFPMTPI